MRGRRRPVKQDDYETRFRCAGGVGILREESWADETGEVIRYNLAFLLPHMFYADHGRVLRFDNAHGVHERHHMGKVTTVKYEGYAATVRRFYREVAGIRRAYEDEGIY